MAKLTADTRVQRGVILAKLALQYPLPTTPLALKQGIEMFYADSQEYVMDLGYLEEKGYIEQKQDKIQGMTVSVIKLTAAGLNILRKVTTDEGVEIAG